MFLFIKRMNDNDILESDETVFESKEIKEAAEKLLTGMQLAIVKTILNQSKNDN